MMGFRVEYPSLVIIVFIIILTNLPAWDGHHLTLLTASSTPLVST